MLNYQALADESIASQDKFELGQLLLLLDRLKPKRILEIGVHRGGVLKTLRWAFRDATIVGIDTDFQWLEFHDFIQVEGDSSKSWVRDHAIDMLGGEIDFLFIDGDHHADAVRRDIELYAGYVRQGGIIAFHDIKRYPGQYDGVDVMGVWDALKQDKAVMEIWGPEGKDSPGIGVLFA